MGFDKTMHVLISSCSDLDIDLQDEDGHTPLIDACISGDSRAVMQLILSGADASLLDNDGNSALAWAEHRVERGAEQDIQHDEFLERLSEVSDKGRDEGRGEGLGEGRGEGSDKEEKEKRAKDAKERREEKRAKAADKRAQRDAERRLIVSVLEVHGGE